MRKGVAERERGREKAQESDVQNCKERVSEQK